MKFRSALTFGEQLESHKGFGPGFDFCRLFLAFSIVLWHSLGAVGDLFGPNDTKGYWMLHYFSLPMFFGLSGFLIAASAQRLDLKNFLVNRGLRILPALGVEVLLSALILGPVFTSFTLQEYFSGKDFFLYLLNIFGVVHFFLPGVFLDNPMPGIVNISLWTVPVELLCYALISFLILFKIVGNIRYLIGVALGYILLRVSYAFLMASWHEPHLSFVPAFLLNGVLFPEWGPGLVTCFVSGIAMYNLRDKIAYSGKILAMAVLIIVAIGLAGSQAWAELPVVMIIINPLLTYIVIFLGLTKFPKLPFFSTGDYSYGIYLYAFPIQQTLVHLMPEMTFPLHFLLSVCLVTVFAVFSWHCVEKPILRLRKSFAFISRRVDAEHGIKR